MIINRPNIHIIQHRHHLLRQPYILILIAHFNAVLLVTDRSNICQVFRCTGTDSNLFFFSFSMESPSQARSILQFLKAVARFPDTPLPVLNRFRRAIADARHAMRTLLPPHRCPISKLNIVQGTF